MESFLYFEKVEFFLYFGKGIFRTLAYLEPWYIENSVKHI